MEFGRPVWVSHSSQGFTKARIEDINAQSIVVIREDDGVRIAAPYDEVFPMEDEDRSVEDHCSLLSLNEASLLNNSKLRFRDKHIYTYVGNVLISVNPYESISGLYSEESRLEYRGKSLGKLPPHIYAIAEKARLELKRNKASQSIVVSGESGSGKTESQKSILSYLCTGNATPLQKRILDINPILEAFGNAKTMRNNNSSRFGKFVEVHFDGETVCGGYISHYLLERSRVTSQQKGERNYHIFYQLIAGADDQTLTRLQLDNPQSFNYLRGCPQFFGVAPSNRCSGGALSDPLLNDVEQFNVVVKALEGTGLKLERIGQIVSVLAGILHLGNITFIEDTTDMKAGCKVDPSTEIHLSHASSLLGVEVNELRSSLTCRIMQPTKGGVKGTLIRVALKPGEAVMGRDALAKAVYSRIFDWIVNQINASIPLEQKKETTFIGVLDIAGFEFFKHNSFEQLCINYCNEKMQNFFAERVMGEEQRLYQRESIPFTQVQYSTNDDAIALFEGKGTGILDLLDEEIRMPRPSSVNFTSTVHKKHEKSFRLDKPRASKEYRNLRDEDGFLVRHFAGTVCYETKEFIDKNKDELHVSLEAVLEGSSVNLLSGLFKTTSADGRSNINKLRASTIGNKFKAQLAVLLQRLDKTGTHFVRCIKPNDEMKSSSFNGALVLTQLRCAGIPSLLTLMHSAYPSRIAFTDLYSLYAPSLPAKLAKLEPRLFCKCLFRALGLSPQDYAFGVSKVFFKSGKFSEFDTIVQGESSNISSLIDKTSRFLITMRWKMVQYCAWSTIKLEKKIEQRREAVIIIQKYARGAAIRRRYTKRIDLAVKIRRLLSALSKAEGSEMGEKIEIENNLINLLNGVMKEDQSIDDAIAAYDDCVRRVDTVIAALKHSEMLRKQREEDERRRKEEEERERRIEEERQQRRRMEEARLKEEEEWKRRKEEEEREEREEKERIEKEKEEKERKRLDATLNADRRMDENVAPPQESVANDLSTWKYSELREAINNSTDIEMLMACKAEFHRRLRVYNEWKAKSTNQNAAAPLPPCRPLPTGNSSLKNNEHRYFKIPLGGTGGQQGLLYIHFDGQWVGRQMEMRPGQKPALLKAGKEDGKMMHMSLEQSGLTRRKGAEIRGDEFETVWTHLGGEPMPAWKP